MRSAQRHISRIIAHHQHKPFRSSSWNTIRRRPLYTLNKQHFTSTPIKKKRFISTWFKRISLTLCGSISVIFAWLYYNHHEEENWKRSFDFWGNLYPIYVHYRFTDIYTKNWQQSDRDEAFDKLHEKYKHKIYEIIIYLKGFYLKLGQLGASRTDIIPLQWVELLRKLEDECPYEPFDVIEEIIKSDFGINSTSEIFEFIDPKPLGSASIGQTHYARLKNGQEVCIKVQYPNAESLFRGDFKMARKFCAMAQPAHLPFLDETEKQFLTEFNYILEAKNLEEIGHNLNENALWKNKVIVPRPYKELCTKNVLTMEYIKGKKLITALKDNFSLLAKERGLSLDEFIEQQKKLNFHPTAEQMKSIHRRIIFRDYLWNALATICNYSFGFLFYALGNANIHFIPYKHSTLPLNVKLILDLVTSVHAYEIFLDGAFNGDPHPGNLLICDDGRLGLIDYGQVKHLSLEQRIELAKLIIYLGQDDKEKIVEQITQNMGFKTKYGDEWVIEKSARFYFDRDDEEITEGMNVQLFMEHLNKRDPVTHLSDDYVMVGRLKVLMSGLHHALGYQFSGAVQWKYWAQQLLDLNNIDPYS